MQCLCGCGQTQKTPSGKFAPGHHTRLPNWKAPHKTHGMTKSTEHIIWAGMKARCCNPNDPEFHNYGARGIGICDKWRDSFEAFLADMGPRPSRKHTLDRRNNELGYSPDNCRWATRDEQCNNRRGNVTLTHAGETLTVAQWSRRIGLSTTAIHQRIRLGWSIDRVLSRHCFGINQYRRATIQA